jgi:threonine aldolase
VDRAAVQTNMVFMSVDPQRAEALREFLRQRNMLIGAGSTVRLVTHLDVNADDIRALAGAIAQFFTQTPRQVPIHA